MAERRQIIAVRERAQAEGVPGTRRGTAMIIDCQGGPRPASNDRRGLPAKEPPCPRTRCVIGGPGLSRAPGLLALPRSRGAGKLGAQEAERQVSVKDE
jgi:hypothetical protein